MDIKTVVAAVFLAVGSFFIVVAAIGVVRFPDFYTRIHPAGKGDTLGQALVITGLIIYEGFSLISVKLLLIMGLIFLVNPTATHFMAKAAYLAGVKSVDKTEELTVTPAQTRIPPSEDTGREVNVRHVH
jgi:multicomponent Na+:H+ antiporter subunit G